MRRTHEVSTFSIRPLAEAGFRIGVNSDGYGDILAPGLAQQAIDELRPRLHVTECGRDAKDLQLRAAERESNSEGVIYVITNIRVDDDFFRSGCYYRGLRNNVCTHQ